MDITRDRTGDRENIRISGDATVRSCKELQGVLLDALQAAPVVRVVLDRIEHLDIALPQLLCSAHLSAAKMQKTLTVEGTDQEAVAKLLDEAGFLRHIGCQDTTRGSCLWTARTGPGEDR